jgi:CBS domain-containing protein
MTSAPQTANPEDPLVEAADRLAASKIGALPVVERGALVGLVTVTDVLAAQVRSAMQPAPRSRATAADAMTRDPITIRSDDSLARAAAKMASANVRHLPVLDDSGALVGMLSERDFRAAIGDPLRLIKPLETEVVERLRVRDAMFCPAITVSQDKPVSQLAMFFADHRIGALAVIDGRGKLVGIVSYVDVLRVLGGDMRARGATSRGSTVHSEV